MRCSRLHRRRRLQFHLLCLHPHRSTPSRFPTCAGIAQHQTRAADRDHVRRGGGIVGEASFRGFCGSPVQVAVVAGGRCDDDAGMVEGAALSSAAVTPCSGPPHESEISLAPSPAAVFSAASRLTNDAELASTSTMWQLWQTAWATSMSRDISPAHPSASSTSLQASPAVGSIPVLQTASSLPSMLRLRERAGSRLRRSD